MVDGLTSRRSRQIDGFGDGCAGIGDGWTVSDRDDPVPAPQIEGDGNRQRSTALLASE